MYMPFSEFSGIPKVSVVQPCRVIVFWSIHTTLFDGDLTSIAKLSFMGFPLLKQIVTLTSRTFMMLDVSVLFLIVLFVWFACGAILLFWDVLLFSVS